MYCFRTPYTPIPVNNLLALHKHYTNHQTFVSGYELGNLYTYSVNNLLALHTPVPINNLLALRKQYTDCPNKTYGYEVGNLYKSLLFIRNITPIFCFYCMLLSGQSENFLSKVYLKPLAVERSNQSKHILSC